MNRREALAALVSLPAVARLSVAELKPDDVLIVEADEHLSADAIQRMYEGLSKVWPGRRVAIFDKGMHLRIAESGKVPN